MSEKLKTYTFRQQLEEGYIRIPRIQRGYAQGRQTKKVDDIRKTFLHTLFQVIKGRTDSTELDFVYGSQKEGAFEPLDGQQRLTTLFLIHWMLGIDLKQKGQNKKSVFTYASCPTSEDFTNELVRHDALALIEESFKKNSSPSELISKREWFHRKWKFDPSISSMLVMIDSIFKEVTSDENWAENLKDYIRNLDHITFNGLNLGDFGLSNELFIKMNARGKQLSDFDKMKSTLEEEIQIQQSEKDVNNQPKATQEEETNWRTLMDGKWSDYFWHTYAHDQIIESAPLSKEERKRISLDAAKKCELQFKKLLLRLIQLQLHSRMPASDELREACYKRNEGDLDNLLITYTDSLLSLRSRDSYTVESTDTMIDFASLIKTINSIMIESEEGKMSDIFSRLPKETHISCDEVTLMQSFLDENVANDVALTFYASLQFLEKYPYIDKSEWMDNFISWIKSLRNILLNNNNTQRIDKRWRYENALNSIQELTIELENFGNVNSIDSSDSDFVYKFFQSLGDKTFIGLDNQSLKEEVDKASAILNNYEWKEAIEEAERDPYLWGQIRSILEWAGDDVEKFTSYATKLSALLELINREPNTYYLASLRFNPSYWVTSNRLYQRNFDRDNSFKRYLRDKDKETDTRAPLIKRMIDLWIKIDSRLNAKEFLDVIQPEEETSSAVWIECLIKEPTILNDSYHKRIYKDRGHVILAQLKTMDSHCFDPILKYLNVIAKKNGYEKEVRFFDSKGDDPHSISFTKDAETSTLKWSDEKEMYDFIKPDGSVGTISANEALEAFISLFK